MGGHFYCGCEIKERGGGSQFDCGCEINRKKVNDIPSLPGPTYGHALLGS